jgi:hypothetical protein
MVEMKTTEHLEDYCRTPKNKVVESRSIAFMVQRYL